jgi:hypothetical protein
MFAWFWKNFVVVILARWLPEKKPEVQVATIQFIIGPEEDDPDHG